MKCMTTHLNRRTRGQLSRLGACISKVYHLRLRTKHHGMPYLFTNAFMRARDVVLPNRVFYEHGCHSTPAAAATATMLGQLKGASLIGRAQAPLATMSTTGRLSFNSTASDQLSRLLKQKNGWRFQASARPQAGVASSDHYLKL